MYRQELVHLQGYAWLNGQGGSLSDSVIVEQEIGKTHRLKDKVAFLNHRAVDNTVGAIVCR